jgi:hypothetical protein
VPFRHLLLLVFSYVLPRHRCQAIPCVNSSRDDSCRLGSYSYSLHITYLYCILFTQLSLLLFIIDCLCLTVIINCL